MKQTTQVLKSALLLASLLFSFQSFSQTVFELMDQDGVNVKAVQDEAERYFAQVGTGKGTGYKLFKRWEYHALSNLQLDGSVISKAARARAIVKNKQAVSHKTISTSNWTELGPLGMGNGTNGYSRGIGRVTAIYVQPTNTNVIYVGSPGGGLWKSTNGGNSWSPLGDEFTDMSIWAVQADPNNPNTVYVGNGSGQLLKSTNGGASFSAPLIDELGSVKSILINPNNSNEIFVCIYNNFSSAGPNSGLYRTTNGGNSWTQVIPGTVEDVMYKPGSTTLVYACGNDFYRSTNGGSSFSQITNGITTSGRMKMAVTQDEVKQVYVVQANGSRFGRLYKSTNNGGAFTKVADENSVGNLVGNQASRDMSIAVSQTDANEVHIGGLHVFKSIDGGTSFVQEAHWVYNNPLPYVHADVEVLKFVNGVLYVGSDGGIFKSTNNGNSFTDLSEGLGIQQFYRIANSASNKNLVAGGSQDNGSVVKSGNNYEWSQWYGGDGMDCMIDPNNENIIYGGSQFGNMKKSTNGGASLASFVRPPEAGSGNWVTPYAMDPDDSNVIYAGYLDLYRHDNGGSSGSWVNVSPNFSFDSNMLSVLEIAPSNGNVIYGATRRGIYRGDNIKSIAPTWTDLDDPTDGTINDIAVDPYDEDRVAVVSSFGDIFLSTDGGVSWIDINDGLTSASVKSVVFDRSSDKGIYAAIDGVVFYRSNSKPFWTVYSNNLPNVDITELELYYHNSNPNKSRIRVATYGRGMWESRLYNDEDIDNNPLSFTPDPNKKYYIDNLTNNLRLASTGSSEDPYTTAINTTGPDVEWKFVAKGNGSWHIDRAAGGTKPRLRTDNSTYADMQSTSSVGTKTYYDFFQGATPGTYYMTLPDGPANHKRLQVTNSGEVKFVTTSSTGTWVSFLITEVPPSASVPQYNLALDGTASQSSIGYNGVPSRAIDNNTNGVWSNNSVTHTLNTSQPWWEVDLGVLAVIDEIEIFNRTNCCMDRLSNFTVTVLDNTGNKSFAQTFTSYPDPSISINTAGITGQKVRVQLNGSNMLSLAEVRVFGYPLASASVEGSGLEEEIQEEENLSLDNILVYPNPVQNLVYVQLASKGGTVELTILDVLGRASKVESYTSHDGLNLLKMDVSDLSAGTYHLRVKKGSEVVTKTIQVQ